MSGRVLTIFLYIVLQIVGPDGKAIKVAPSQQVVVDKLGQPVIGADSKAILVPAGSTIVVPHADGKSSIMSAHKKL